MTSLLSLHLTRTTVRQLADERAYVRGEDYFRDGRVRSLVEHDGMLAARVQGTQEYRVRLWLADDHLGAACTCPLGQKEDRLCKHGVAVGLAWLAQKGTQGTTGRAPGAAGPAAQQQGLSLAQVQEHLLSLDRQALVGLLLEQALEDEGLRDRLLLRAAAAGSGKEHVATLRSAIDRAVAHKGPVDFRAAPGYGRGLARVVAALEALLPAGQPLVAVELSEHAIAALSRALPGVADAGGQVAELLRRLQGLHLCACQAGQAMGRIDTEALARRLFDFELCGEHEVFRGAVMAYAAVLGKQGLFAYTRLAQQEWALVPPLRPGQDDPERYGRRARLTYILETLSWQAGDLDALLLVKGKNLSTAYDFLQIAEIHRHSQNPDQALSWAERGVRAFPRRTDSRLRHFLVQEYLRRGRKDQALLLIWAEFTDRPDLLRYRQLREHARRCGRWASLRREALTLVSGLLRGPDPVDRADLLRILLSEDQVEAAWQAAQRGEVPEDLWLDLLLRRAQDHPQDALPLYQQKVEAALARKNNAAYEQAVQLLRRVTELLCRMGRGAEVPAYLAGLRTTHKAKRNFIRLLDRVPAQARTASA